jgi:hypothetical protein
MAQKERNRVATCGIRLSHRSAAPEAGFGLALQTSTGETHAFVATPTSPAAAAESVSPGAQGATSPMVLPENARKQLQQRLRFGRPGAQLGGPK